MHSSDAAVAARARYKLFELDRPAIDEVLPELVASELAVRVSKWPVKACVATIDSREWVVDRNLHSLGDWHEYDLSEDPTAKLLAARLERRAIVLVWNGFGTVQVSRFAIPLDDDLAPEILTAVRAELGDRAP